jgi:hypothetical protein
MNKELIELLREATDFWEHYSAINESEQDDIAAEKADMLKRMREALAQPAAQAVLLDCRMCAYFSKTCGCVADVQCVNGDRFVATRPHQYWEAAPEGK